MVHSAEDYEMKCYLITAKIKVNTCQDEQQQLKIEIIYLRAALQGTVAYSIYQSEHQ
jgi:hypothetical protein